MGKKVKTGKRRKDKFYHLAKETGYRARSAFKLIQLNRKFGFLEKSRCVIDLCAAPGGWLQVASKFMPVSSIIVGVDLVPIKTIRNVITIQADITTDKCKQMVGKELHTWKADCVLNDGAPNVGSAWVQDAFTQAHLTLAALKLACDFLREGGWFITKVFRSKDYQPLLWVFQQLFKKVHSTKPQASRNESAEIFVVCQGYIAPDKIDPKMLDWKHIFKEVQPEGKKKPSILQPEKKKRAEGYEEGDYTLHKSMAVMDFINSEDPLEFLSSVNSIRFNDQNVLGHPSTTEEIKASCKDIKVLGKADVRALLAWQRHMRKELNIGDKKDDSAKDQEPQEEENEEEMIQKTVQAMQEEDDKEEKRKKKKVQAQRQKLKERMQLKMVLPGDTKDIMDEKEIFALSRIRSKKELAKVDDVEADYVSEEEDSDEEMADAESDSDSDLSSAESEEGEDDEESSSKDYNQNMNYRVSDEEKNPLLVDFVPDEDAKTKTDRWFSKDVFKGLEDEEDEDMEISQMVNEYKKKGGTIIEKDTLANKTEKRAEIQSKNLRNSKENSGSESSEEESSESDDDDGSESDYEMEALNHPSVPSETAKSTNNKGEDFEVVPAESNTAILKKLTAEGLALGAQMAFSRKRKRDIIDDSFHRWTFNDEGLPSWFAEDEAKYYQKRLPVTKEEVNEYKARMREINARPIKKVAEAKAKKKAKEMKRMEKARKKAEAICDTVDVSEREKMQQIKTLYKKAGVVKKRKPEPQYVVAKKSLAAKRMKRPAGVKGIYKIVDPRMKKDLRARKAKDKTVGRGKKSKKSKR